MNNNTLLSIREDSVTVAMTELTVIAKFKYIGGVKKFCRKSIFIQKKRRKKWRASSLRRPKLV